LRTLPRNRRVRRRRAEIISIVERKDSELTATHPSARATGSSPTISRLPSLTGLRFIAALCIFIVHATLMNNPLAPREQVSLYADRGFAQWLSDLFVPMGFICLSFFFILSGFVLNWSITPGERARAIWRRRLLKVFPNHIITWALAMILFAAAFTPWYSWLPNLFLVHTWSSDPLVQSGVNMPAWSLCAELLFYMLFPFLIAPIRRIAENRLWWWAGAMVAGIVLVNLATVLFIPGTPKLPLLDISLTQMWFSYMYPPVRLFEFVLGMILARIVIAGRWPRIPASFVVLLTAIGWAAASFVPLPWSFSLVSLVPNAVLICAAASADVRGAKTWLASRPMVWLGNISFAFFLTQATVVFWGRTVVTGTYDFLTASALWLGFFVVNIVVAWLLFTFVEDPIMRRWARSRKRARAAAPTPPARLEGHPPAGEGKDGLAA
jgi:peptidoglycan/LPS O-acetylase OafA/YrhL